MKRALLGLLAVAVAGSVAPADDPPGGKKAPIPPLKKLGGEQKTDQAALMAKKLDHAKRLLEGLTLNDFDKITKSAEELMLISQKAEFMARKTREYELQTNDFRRALETITKKAKEKNVDGATLGYVDMTLACVRCHQHTRETRIGRLPVPGADAVAGQ